ncbi:MAG TPA: hypothetical protein VE826_01495 [Dongiaceae bacterium]|nr:hypothetical protein [Dongiaceae bacterium]
MNRYRNFLRAGFVALAPLLIAACQDGGANTPPLSTGNQGPPGTLTVSPNSLSFSGTGPAFAQNVTITVSVPTNTITVTPDAACGSGSNALVTVANPQQNGNTFTAAVTPQKVGTCNITLTSGSGGTAQFKVTVNSGTVTITSRNSHQ